MTSILASGTLGSAMLQTRVVEDFGGRLDAHNCADEQCSGDHFQAVLVSPEDVETPAAEIRMLIEVRDQLTVRGLTMGEGEPTPRFDDSDDGEPRSWRVTYRSTLPSARDAARPGRSGFIRRLLGA